MRTLPLPALLSLLGGLSACVVPVGPEWTDPASNYPPTIVKAEPVNGSPLTPDADAGTAPAVTVWLADQNTHDKLYVRWIIDYPPFVEEVTRLAPQDILPPEGRIERLPVLFAPSCNDDKIASGFTSHRLMMAASDRRFAFDDPHQGPPDQPTAGYSVVRGIWQFDTDCP